jgi:UDP-N-acetylglucosamine 4-epimerase
MSRFAPLFEGHAPRRWLVTGAAGFIGSNLVQARLECGQQVIGLDNFSTGHRRNLDDVRLSVSDAAWKRFVLLEGDVQDRDLCALATANADVVLHQAALGSVPRSIAAPMGSFGANVRLIKRQMYGHAKLDLLAARFLATNRTRHRKCG